MRLDIWEPGKLHTSWLQTWDDVHFFLLLRSDSIHQLFTTNTDDNVARIKSHFKNGHNHDHYLLSVFTI